MQAFIAGPGTRHFLHPSNFGIIVTLLLFSGLETSYHFTENLRSFGDWILSGLIVVSGTFLNAGFIGRLPLIAAWVGGYTVQAAGISLIFNTPDTVELLPMIGLAFVLYMLYLLTDLATTPSGTRGQFAFGQPSPPSI